MGCVAAEAANRTGAHRLHPQCKRALVKCTAKSTCGKFGFGRFVNTLGKPMSFINLTGHMHKRGLMFTAWRSNGTKLYQNFDWAHPLGVLYDPPFVLASGDWIDYECLHDNGVTRPVKLDAFGKPTDLRFGVTTDDEMCILPGVYYTD